MPTYKLEGKKYNVPEGTTLGELDTFISGNKDKDKSKDKNKDNSSTLDKVSNFIVGDTSKMSAAEVYARSLMEPIKDLGVGVAKGLSSIAQLPRDMAVMAADSGAIPFVKRNPNWDPTGKDKPLLQKFRESLPQPRTGLGNLIEGVGKVGVGLAGAGKIKFASAWLTRVAQGAAIDFSVFSPEEKNLSNLIQEQPNLANVINGGLANKEGDLAVKNRLRSAIEGGLIGGTLEVLFKAYKVARVSHLKRVKEDVTQLNNKILNNSNIKAAKGSKEVEELTNPDNIKIDTSTSIRDAKKEQLIIMKDINDRAPEGFKLHPSDGNPLINTKLAEPVVKSVTLAAESAAKGNPELAKALLDKNSATYHKIIDSILLNEINVEMLPKVLKKYNISPAEFGNLWKQTVSTSAKNLAFISHMNRRLGKIFKEDEKATTHFGKVNEAIKKWYKGNSDIFDLLGFMTSKIENTRRALLVVQPKTAIRNFKIQSIRAGIADVDEYFQATMRGVINNTVYKGKQILGKSSTKPITIAEELGTVHSMVKAGFRQLPIISKKWRGGTKSRKILDNYLESTQGALVKAKMNSATMLEIYQESGIHGSILNTLNFLNKSQEMFFRRAAFDSKARQILAKKGKVFNIDNLKKLDDSDVEKIIDHTLEMTFARSPKTPFVKGLVRHWSRNPLLTIVNPFPRFHFANALPFFHEFSPIGFIKPSTARAIMKGDVDEISKIGSRTAIGVGMWYTGWQAYQNFGTNGRWFEMTIPKDFIKSLSNVERVEVGGFINREDKAGNIEESKDGSALIYDSRGDAPVSSMFFVMHSLDSIIKGNSSFDKIPPKDIFQQMIGLNRVSGTGLEFFRLFEAKNIEDVNRVFHNIAAQYIGSFSVPFKQFKDAYTEMNPNEAIRRDIRQGNILAPFVNNIPGLSQDLPPAYSPFDKGNIPILKDEGFNPDNIEDQLAYDTSAERYFLSLWGTNGKGIGKPLFTQALGITLKHKVKIEREVDRLNINKQGIYARSGDKRTDNLLNGYRGYFASQIIAPILLQDRYKSMGEAQKKIVLKDLISAGRTYSSAILASKHSGLFFKALNRREDQDILDFAKERGFDVESNLKAIEDKLMEQEKDQERAPQVPPR